MTPEQTDIQNACTNMETEELIERLDSNNLTAMAKVIYEKELISRDVKWQKKNTQLSSLLGYKSYKESANNRYLLVFLAIVMLLMSILLIATTKSTPLGATSILIITGLFLLVKYSRIDNNIILTVYPDYLEYSPAPGQISILFFKDIIKLSDKIKFIALDTGGSKKAATIIVRDDHGKPVKKYIAAIGILSKADRKEVFATIQRFLEKY